MKTDKKIFALLLFALSSLLTGCDKDYVYGTEIRIENASQHDIEIEVYTNPGGDRLIPIPLELKAGESHTGVYSTEGGFCGYPNFISAQIRFDGSIEIIHRIEDGDAYHNFCDRQACSRSQPKKRSEIFTFVFTNADYEYAVQHANITE